MTIVPAPSFVLFTQLLSSAVMVKAMSASNVVDAEPFQCVLTSEHTLYTSLYSYCQSHAAMMPCDKKTVSYMLWRAAVSYQSTS